MNITDTSANGYQNVKLAGNDNASTTGELDVDGGTLTIDAPSFAFGGGYKSNGWVDVAEAQVTIKNGGKITGNAISFRNGVNSTMTLDNGTFELTAAGEFGNVHSTLGNTIDNFGTIIAKNSILDFGENSVNNTGSITVSGGLVDADKIDNTGKIVISNESSWDATITGNAAEVAAKAVINGALTADLALKGNITQIGRASCRERV